MVSMFSILFIICAIILAGIVDYIYNGNNKCPSCKRKWSSKKVDEISLGGHFCVNGMQKYRVYYECNHCNTKWSRIEEQSDSTD